MLVQCLLLSTETNQLLASGDSLSLRIEVALDLVLHLLSGGCLLDAAESDLAGGQRPAARPLPQFQVAATPLAVPLLLLALLLLVIRVYV